MNLWIFFWTRTQMKNTRVITIEGVPGTLDAILSQFQDQNVAVIHKSSETRRLNLSSSIVHSARDLLNTMKHIKRCMGHVDVIIVPHFLDIPMERNHDDFAFARSYILRHHDVIRRAIGLDRVDFDHVHISLSPQYTFEILLQSLSCQTLGTGDFTKYASHLDQLNTCRRIDVVDGAFHTDSIRREIVEKILSR